MKLLFQDMVIRFGFSQFVPMIQELLFAWRYLDSISSLFYKPTSVFKNFEFADVLNDANMCVCNSAKRLRKFLDPLMLQEATSYSSPLTHVRTVNCDILQHADLRRAVAMGLNHIPLKPTNIAVCIATILDAFDQTASILGLENHDFPVNEAKEWVRVTCLGRLKNAKNINKFGFRSSQPDLFSIPAVLREVEWITDNLYCAGLDKASNNICFICVKHIRLLALQRLMSSDFSPCQENCGWLPRATVIEIVTTSLRDLVPKLNVSYNSLPYLMATYKLHKNKYRWLTNAFRTVYSNLAHMLTIATMLILDKVKEWASNVHTGYINFLRVDTSAFWLVNSAIEVALNLPNKISNIYVADITRCYETIPLQGDDNLSDAIAHIIRVGFKQEHSKHPRSNPLVWIRVDKDGNAANATWGTTCPAYGNCFSLSEDRLINLHTWLMNHCYVGLGDRVWIQSLGIPMGFSCSPLWCNLYLLHYEIQFIQRLGKLGKKDLMKCFKYSYRYIDDLCWVNNDLARLFLDPNQARTSENPYWVYPLNVLEIKCEVAKFAQNNPLKGIRAHFMNLDITIKDDESGSYQTAKFEKRRDLPFQYSQYIHFRSNRPIRQSYAIAVSQTVPILYLSNNVEAAHKELELLIATLQNNGFQRNRLLGNINQFLQKNTFPGIKFDLPALLDILRYFRYLTLYLLAKEKTFV